MSDTLQPTPADLSAELTLRPASLGEYIGQTEAKRSLTTLLQAARQRGEAADHLLGRLRERIQTETWAFYATGLQSGAISLR